MVDAQGDKHATKAFDERAVDNFIVSVAFNGCQQASLGASRNDVHLGNQSTEERHAHFPNGLRGGRLSRDLTVQGQEDASNQLLQGGRRIRVHGRRRMQENDGDGEEDDAGEAEEKKKRATNLTHTQSQCDTI